MDDVNTKCYGSCLMECSHHNYIKISECDHGCELYECSNYELCNSKVPERILLEHGGGRCTKCEFIIGQNLVFRHYGEDVECKRCRYSSSIFVDFINCSKKHAYCVRCTRLMLLNMKNEPADTILCQQIEHYDYDHDDNALEEKETGYMDYTTRVCFICDCDYDCGDYIMKETIENKIKKIRK